MAGSPRLYPVKPKKRVAGSVSPAAGAPEPTAWKKLALARVDGLAAHDRVIEGVRVDDAHDLLNAFKQIKTARLYQVLGINPKTMQRRSTRTAPTLDMNASDRALRLVAIARLAIHVLGSQAAAEDWLERPAIGLDRRKPIELLQSSEGTEMVKTLLTRMDYGVYV